MTRTVNSILELIGNTPMVKLNRIINGQGATVYAKLESFNPLRSIKDRICLSMIEEAEQRGLVKPGDTIIEPTSGNTGIGLAYITAIKGYKLVLTMPETMSFERQKVLKAFGTEIILTKGSKGMKGAVEKASKLAQKKGWFQPQQFRNKANPAIHKRTTALEIIEQVPKIDAFVAGIGTGGTLTGVGEVLRENYGRKVTIIAVEPKESAVLSGEEPGPHKIQGIGAGFIPEVLNTRIIDKIIKVTESDAFETARQLVRQEGIFAGVSSGAACWAALEISKKLGRNKNVVVIFPDHGERYLSTSLFDEA
jgi:cysteine synthase A